ncbi:MAG: hypothetical protein NC938_06105 [Candidatus Omnitrophica bacterium]|nr:hypothetical protein [Candidatus Omnitrophota bacterium]
MWYMVVIVAIVCVAIFMLVSSKNSARKAKETGQSEDKAFRSEEELEEYAKPMKDPDSTTASDFNEAE